MTPIEERKFLLDTLKSLQAPVQTWSWPAFLMELLVWCGLAVVALWVVNNPGKPDLMLVAALIGVFIGGAVLGAVSLWRNLCHRGALVRPYIDQDRMRARLSELEA